MREIRGAFDTHGRRFAVVAAQFNQIVTGRLVEGALSAFRSHGVAHEDLTVVWVPGAFEVPFAARMLAASDRYDGVVCVGAVVRGETAHFEHISTQSARGIADAARDTGVPVMFGILTTETMEQALDRAGGKHGNKGWDAAMAAMEMASVSDQIREKH